MSLRAAASTVAVLLASLAFAADQAVNLPYMQQDKDGVHQWVVHYYGYLQQQGNMPVYSSAGVLTINGNSTQGRMQRQAVCGGTAAAGQHAEQRAIGVGFNAASGPVDVEFDAGGHRASFRDEPARQT